MGRYAKRPFSVSIAAVVAPFFCSVSVHYNPLHYANNAHFFWVVLAHHYSAFCGKKGQKAAKKHCSAA
jgi:hypothetical protein